MRAHLVDVVLHDSSPDHGSRTGEEASGYPLDRGKVDAYLAKAWIDEQIADRNDDDQGERVEIVDDIIWDTIGHHRGSLRRQIVDNLPICEPCSKRQQVPQLQFSERRTIQGKPNENGACLEATTDLVYPVVTERHPLWPLAIWDVARLGRFPEVVSLEVFVQRNRVQRPSSSCGIRPELEGLGEHGTLRGRTMISLATKEKDDGTE